jgi:sugar phosphate isomerase/epimerase
MIKIGANTLPIAGWLADPQRPEDSRRVRLAAIRQLIEGYGLAAVELTADLSAVYAQVFDHRFFSAVAGLQQGLGFICTVHLPFLWVDASSLNEAVRQTSANCLCRAIELTQPLDVSTYVLHLWGLTTAQIATLVRDPAQRQVIVGGMLAQARRSLSQVCEMLDPRGVCVENLEDPLFDLMLPLLEEYRVSICLDVGHLAWRGDSELDFLARHGDRIREVHLHDAVDGLHGLSAQAGGQWIQWDGDSGERKQSRSGGESGAREGISVVGGVVAPLRLAVAQDFFGSTVANRGVAACGPEETGSHGSAVSEG